MSLLVTGGCSGESASVGQPQAKAWPHSWLMVLMLPAVLTALAFGNVIRDPLRAVQEDIALNVEGLNAAANEQIAAGRFPHWNMYALGGERLFADPHLALLYPGSVFFRLLPFDTACVCVWVLHYSAIFVTTFLLCRRMMKVGHLPAAMGGVVFAYGGFALGHCNHLNFVFALPYLPLLLLAVHELWHASGKALLGWSWAAVLCVAFMLLSGGTPVLLLAMVGVAWMLANQAILTVRHRYWLMFARLVTVTIASVGMAFALAAVQVLPALDLYRGSAREQWATDCLTTGGVPWRTLVIQAIAPGVLGDVVHGTWGQAGHETFFFVGSIAITFAFFAIMEWSRLQAVRSVTLLLLLGLLLSLGDTPVLRVVQTVLPVNMRGPARFLGLVHLAIALLAAAGADRWLRRDRHPISRGQEVLCLLISMALAAGTLGVLRWAAEGGRRFSLAPVSA